MTKSLNLEDLQCFNIDYISFVGCYSLYYKNQLIQNVINWLILFGLIIFLLIFIKLFYMYIFQKNKILLGKIINVNTKQIENIYYSKNTKEFNVLCNDGFEFLLSVRPIELNYIFSNFNKITVCDHQILKEFFFHHNNKKIYINDNIETLVINGKNKYFDILSNYYFTKLKNIEIIINKENFDFDSTKYYIIMYNLLHYIITLNTFNQLKSIKIIDNCKLILSQEHHNNIQSLKNQLNSKCVECKISLQIQ